MSLESVQHHIIYNAQHKVLICKKHENGITDVDRHFRGTGHENMTTKTRLAIRVATQHLELTNLQDIVIPSANSFPIEGLEVVKNGAKCKECGHLAGTIDTMENHCRNKHNWKTKDGSMWTQQAVQTFFQGTM